ncbi:MAG: hypothetical protein NTZ16_12845, partial [Verrucomicrobia bacterium]|nr:hypothetical protein [Verrucomicrobiota bacterium]
MSDSIFQALADAARHGERVALGIITGVKGSSPQKVGAKALFHPDRRIAGTPLASGKPTTFDMVLDHDFGWDDSLICGGRVQGVVLPDAQNAGEKFWAELAARATATTWGVNENFSILPVADDSAGWIYRETVTPPGALWIAGSGHIAQAVAPLALQLDFAVTIFDDRPELANH